MSAKQGDLRRAPLPFLLLALVAGSAGAQETESNVVRVRALVKSPRGEIVYDLEQHPDCHGTS
jgi:hypothetical protein